MHIPIVKEILKPEYDVLLALDCKTLLEYRAIQARLIQLNQRLFQLYENVRSSVKEEVKGSVSSVLITKVLLGTLGCTPAYDRFFMQAVKKHKVTSGNYSNPNFSSIKSLLTLAEFYQQHRQDV